MDRRCSRRISNTDYSRNKLSNHQAFYRYSSIAFTLVELLVVVAIIALLLSILVPSLSRARDKAKMMKCLSNQRQMGTLGATFAQDRNNHFQLVANGFGLGQAGDPTNVDFDGLAFGGQPNGELIAWPVALARTQGVSYKHNWEWGVRGRHRRDPGLDPAKPHIDKMSKQFQAAICPADNYESGISSPFYPEAANQNPSPPSGVPNPPTGSHPHTRKYWGFLSYSINEDVVGTETNIDGGNRPACYREEYDTNGLPVSRRGEIDAQAGRRLRGYLDYIYDPATCMLIVDGGLDTYAQEVWANSGNDYFPANLVMSAKVDPASGPQGIRGWSLGAANYRWLTRLPNTRHPERKLCVLLSDFHAEIITPARQIGRTIAGASEEVTYSFEPEVRVSPYTPFPSDMQISFE